MGENTLHWGEALQTTFSVFLDIFYPPNFDCFDENGVFQQPRLIAPTEHGSLGLSMTDWRVDNAKWTRGAALLTFPEVRPSKRRLGPRPLRRLLRQVHGI